MNKVYITASEAITSYGLGLENIFESLKNQKKVLHYPSKDEIFKKPFYRLDELIKFDNDKTKCASITLKLMEMLEDKFDSLGPLPLFLATSTSGIKEIEEAFFVVLRDKSKYPLSKNYYFYDMVAEVKKKYKDKITDTFSISTACSSVGHSLLHAYRYIKAGVIDKALVCGVDALSLTTLIGFDSLKLYSNNPCKPMTGERDGLTLGEGGAIVLLESEPTYEPIGEIVGACSNTDGYHLTAPNPEGKQQALCINDALKQANLDPKDIDYISAHGTGTVLNDEIELKVIKSIFPDTSKVTALKYFFGHTLGASAIIEISVIFEMLKNNIIIQPENMAPVLDENYIPGKSFSKPVNYFLKNAFGFGGNNVCLALKNLYKQDLK